MPKKIKPQVFGPVPGGPDPKPRKTNRPFVKKPLKKPRKK